MKPLTLVERNIDIQEVVRRVVANLNMPPVSVAQCNAPTNSQSESTSISEELNNAFQIPRGREPSTLRSIPGTRIWNEISQLSSGFSNNQNYGGRSGGQRRRGRQERLNLRTASGRFYAVRTSRREHSAVDWMYTKDVCLLPSLSWNKVPRGRMKAFLINRGMYVDAWPVLKDWNEATLRLEIQRLF